jgi:hypothetical protein
MYSGTCKTKQKSFAMEKNNTFCSLSSVYLTSDFSEFVLTLPNYGTCLAVPVPVNRCRKYLNCFEQKLGLPVPVPVYRNYIKPELTQIGTGTPSNDEHE